MNKKTIWEIIVGVIVVILIVVGVTHDSKKVSGEPIKIGADFSLSSFGAGWGEHNRDAALLAVKEINASGGINGQPIELIIEDNKSSVTGAVDAARKLINVDKVHILLNGWADYVNPVAPLLAPNKVVGVTVSAGSPDITKQSAWLFRTWPKDSFLSQGIADYMNKQGYKKIGIFQTIGAWENGTVSAFKDQLSALGMTVVVNEAINPESKDVKTALAKIKSANPDALYVIALEPTTGLFMNELKKIGYEIPKFFAVEANSPSLIKAAGGVANMEGLIYPIVKAPQSDFITNYTKEYGQAPGVSADTTYDAVRILAEVIKKVGDNPEKIRDELAKIKNYNGASGLITFDENRDRNEAPVKLMVVKGGQFVEVK